MRSETKTNFADEPLDSVNSDTIGSSVTLDLIRCNFRSHGVITDTCKYMYVQENVKMPSDRRTSELDGEVALQLRYNGITSVSTFMNIADIRSVCSLKEIQFRAPRESCSSPRKVSHLHVT